MPLKWQKKMKFLLKPFSDIQKSTKRGFQKQCHKKNVATIVAKKCLKSFPDAQQNTKKGVSNTAPTVTTSSSLGTETG